MKRMNHLIRVFTTTTVAILLLCNVTIAQLNPRSSLYSFHQSSYNPAICGAYDYGSADLVLRRQYMNFPDNAGPSTTWFDVSMPIYSIHSGAGISISQTTEGFEKRLTAKLNYAYQLDLRSGRLGFGLSAGLNSAEWDLSSAIYPDGSSDNFLETSVGSQDKFLNLLLGFGMFYQTGNLHAALAVTELNEPSLKYGNEKMDYLKRHYWLSAEYEYKTSSPKLVLFPSMTLKTTFANLQANFDLRAVINNALIAGVCYSSSHDVSLNLGFQFKDGSKFDGLRTIVSYDIITSQLGSESTGSLEVMVSYDFNLSIEKENKSYKSVRFL